MVIIPTGDSRGEKIELEKYGVLLRNTMPRQTHTHKDKNRHLFMHLQTACVGQL
jgi:hypothetical protein